MTEALIDWDWLYYLYVIEMGRTDSEFWSSPLCRIFSMIDRKASIMSKGKTGARDPDIHVKSLKEIPGWC